MRGANRVEFTIALWFKLFALSTIETMHSNVRSIISRRAALKERPPCVERKVALKHSAEKPLLASGGYQCSMFSIASLLYCLCVLESDGARSSYGDQCIVQNSWYASFLFMRTFKCCSTRFETIKAGLVPCMQSDCPNFFSITLSWRELSFAQLKYKYQLYWFQ